MISFRNNAMKTGVILAGMLAGIAVSQSWAESGAKTDALKGKASTEKGKALVFDRKKGNCLSCHIIAGGTLMGTTAPPLVQMQARFPDKSKLYDQIWDARSRNPYTIMPPLGSHGILTREEVEAVVDYLYTL